MEGKRKKALLEAVSNTVSGYAVVVLALVCFIVGLMAVIALTRFIAGLGVVQTAPSSAHNTPLQSAFVAPAVQPIEESSAVTSPAATFPAALASATTTSASVPAPAAAAWHT